MNKTVQKWFDDPEFKALPLSEKEKALTFFFDREIAGKDAEGFGRLPSTDQRRVRNNFVEMNLAPNRPAPPSRGLLSDIMVSGGRAAAGVPEMFLHGAAGVDELVERHVLPEDGGFDLKKWARAKARDIEGFKEEKLPLSKETLTGGPRSWITGGLESAGTSLSIKLPATLTGFALAGPLGAVIGWLSGVPLFSMAQYDQSLQEHLKAGVSEPDAEEAAIFEAASEGGFELLSDVIEVVTLGTGGILSAPGKEALKKGAVKVLKGAWKQSLKKGAAVAGAETLGELSNIGVQAEIRAQTGIGDQRFWQAIKENLGSVTVASLIFGTLGGGLNLTNAHITRKLLEDQTADPERRLAAVKEVANALNKSSPEVSRQWTAGAVDAVTVGEPIKLTIEKPVDTAKVAAEKEKTLKKNQPLASNAEAVADIGKKTQKPIVSEIETPPRTPSPEMSRGAGAAMAASAEPVEDPLMVQPRSMEELEAMLSPGQRQTIKDRAEEMAVEDAATDDITREYARAVIAKHKAGIPSPEAEVEPGDEKVEPAKVKFIITAQDKANLKELGYSDDQINKMKPNEAQRIIEAGKALETKPQETVGAGAVKPSAVQILTGKRSKKAEIKIDEPKAGGGEPPEVSTATQILAGKKPETKKEKALREYTAFVVGLTAEEKGIAGDLIVEAPEFALQQKLKIEKKLTEADEKEPWKIPLKEFVKTRPVEKYRRVIKKEDFWHGLHSESVRQAVESGDPVPDEVLKDYPNLQKKKSEKLKPNEIGRNIYGERVGEDEGGRYTVTDSGIRAYAARPITPTRAGVISAPYTAQELFDKGSESYLSREEYESFTAEAKGEEKTPEKTKETNKDEWKRVPGGALVSTFGNYLISGEPGQYRLSDESNGQALGTLTNLETAKTKASNHWIKANKDKKEETEKPINTISFEKIDEKTEKPTEPLTRSKKDTIIGQKEPTKKPASEMTADDLLAEWDLQAAETEPAPEPEAKEKPVELVVTSLVSGKTETISLPEPLTAKDKAKETADHLKNAFNAFKDINKILGEEGAVGELDPKKWEQIRPLLKLAWDEVLAAGKSGKEFVALALKNLRSEGRPYFEKFVREEVGKEGQDERTNTGTNVLDEGEADLAAGKRTAGGQKSVSEKPERTAQEVAGKSPTSGIEAPETDAGRGSGRGPDRRDSAEHGGPERGSTVRAAAGSAGTEDQGLVGESELAPEDRSHVIEEDDVIVPKGPESRIQANIKAIQLLKKLQTEDRNPTPDEKKILAQYVGWGAFSQKVFNREFTDYLKNFADYRSPESHFYNDSGKKYLAWKKKYGTRLHPALGGLLSDEEWKSAEESTINAHYTSRSVIKSMWAMAERLGFKGGTVLEPGAGVGHFFGLMPQGLAENSSLFGVELDTITGGILEKLYPQAHIQTTAFEKSKGIADNSIDLTITNVPFANYRVIDKKHPDYSGWSLHNYFFGRSLSLTKPGGLVVAITSSWTMDAKSNGKVREYLASKADLVGAIRLPNTAFAENAGTEVVTDILIFRKKDSGNVSAGNDFRVTHRLETKQSKQIVEKLDAARKRYAKLNVMPKGRKRTKAEKETLAAARVEVDNLLGELQGLYGVNEYFIQNPEMVLGEHSMKGTMYAGDSYTVTPTGNLEEQIQEIVQRLPENIAGEGTDISKIKPVLYADLDSKEGTLTQKDGKIYLVDNGRMVEPFYLDTKGKKQKVAGVRLKRLKSYLELRDLTTNLFEVMADVDTTDDDITYLQDKLNKKYDAYVKKYNHFGHTSNSYIRKVDNDFAVVDALEIETKDGPEDFVKAPIFNTRTIFPFVEPTTAESIEDAANLSIIYRGSIQPAYIASLTGTENIDQVKSDLIKKGLAFIDPTTGLMEAKDLYLSGNVKKKLKAAKIAVEENPEYKHNIKALEAVVPEDMDIAFIEFRLGSSWIPTDVVQGFLKEVLEVNAKVEYAKTDVSSRWLVSREGYGNWDNVKNRETYGTEDNYGTSLIEAALNLKRITIKKKMRNEAGNEVTYEDKDASKENNLKIQEINTEFVTWAKTHEKWAPKLAEVYNEEKNGHVLRKHSAPVFKDAEGNKTLHYPNASTAITLREHQRIAVSRALQESVLLAYGVGTGKTYIFITAAMEMRRIGTARKPIIVVHNQTIDQYRQSFKVLYPGAKVLIPNYHQRSSRMRKKTLVSMATGDWDAIVLPQSFFDGIANDPARETAFVEEQLDMIDEQISDAESEDGKNSLTVKELVKLKKQKRQKLEALLDRRKDEAVIFEQMGVDALLIDEVHAYKRSEFYTKMNKVKGIDSGSSQRSTSLILKSEFVREKTGGKNVITATGTPISNTMAELWTMLRYVRPDLLEEYGVTLFDDFAGAFGNVVEGTEETASGYKLVDRFAEYVNGPELLTMFYSGADVRLTKDANLNLPKMKGGKPHVVVSEKSPELTRYIKDIIRQWKAWENLTGREKMKNRHVPLVLYGRAKKAAIDLRLIDPDYYKDDQNSKISKAAENIYKVWKETARNKSTQIAFLDVFRDRAKNERFNGQKDLKEKLMATGVPSKEIAIFSDAGTSETKQSRMKESIRNGDIRVVIGSTAKLGIGVDIADKMIGAHHINVPDRPMDIEQRDGRIIRQTNENEEVEIYHYCTKETLDSVMFGRLMKKQRYADQVLTGDVEGRTFKDPYSVEQASFAEFAAASSGKAGKLLFEKNELLAAENKYKVAQTAHIRRVSNARKNVNQIPNEINALEDSLSEENKLKKHVEDTFEGVKLGTVTFDGETMDRTDAVKKIEERVRAIADGWKKQLEGMAFGDYQKLVESQAGKYPGSFFHDEVRETVRAKAGGIDIKTILSANTNWKRGEKPSQKIKFNKEWGGEEEQVLRRIRVAYFYNGKNLDRANIDPDTLGHNFTRKFNDMLRVVAARPGITQKSIDKSKNDLAEFKNISKEAFKYKQELSHAQKRIADIDRELVNLSNEETEGMPITAQETTKEIEKEAEVAEDKPQEEIEKKDRAASVSGSVQYYAFRDKEFVPVEGKKVKEIDGFDAFLNKYNDRWEVIEARSGLSMGSGETQEKAIDKALENINRLGIDHVNKSIETAVSETGESPWSSGGHPEFSTRTTLAEYELTQQDIQDIYEKRGMQAGISPEGHVWVKTKPGYGFEVRLVDHISEDTLGFEVGIGQMQKDGKLIAGKYENSTIELRKDVADIWALHHEEGHLAEDIGLLAAADIRVLNSAVRKEKKDDAYRPTKEDRANWIESNLEAREKYRDRGRLFRVLQKIRDLIDALVNLAERTTSKSVLRGFETGKLFEREGRPTVAEAVKKKGPLYKVIEPGPVMGKQALDDIEKDRSFANRIFEQRDVGVKEAELETQELQKEVQRLAGPKSRRRFAPFAYDKELKRSRESDRLDMAMMIFRDLKINPDKAQEFRQWAKEALENPKTPKGRKIQIKEYLDILDRAEKLTDEQKALVDDIGRRFDRAFMIAQANKVVSRFLDHYVRRVWSLPKGKESDFRSSGAAYGFKTFTTAKMQRKFETILDGWTEGYDLKIKGLTNSYGAYIADLEAILANKDFIVQGYSTVDTEGRHLFSTSRKGPYKDYAPLKAPGFKVWEWAGRVETEIAPDESNALLVDDYGRKFFFGAVEREPETWAVFTIDEDGNRGNRALRAFLDQKSAEEFAERVEEESKPWAVYKIDDEGNRGNQALRVFKDQKAAEEFAGEKDFETHIEHRPAKEIETHIEYRPAKDIADAWEERQLYAPKQLAEIINKMTAGDRLFPQTPALESLTRFNIGLKAWILLSSFFHHIAGARSWTLGVHHGWKAGQELKDPVTGETYTASGWNPVTAFKSGMKKIEDRAPIVFLGIKNGLTIGELQDWSEALLRDRKNVAERLANYLGMKKTGQAIAHVSFLREKFTDSLFKKYFAGLKAEAFVMEYIHELQKAQTAHLEKGIPPPDVNKIAEQVARLINADFGGLHLQRMGRNPTLQKILRLLLLAPDWTESNFRTVTGLIPGLNEWISKAVGDVKPPPGMDKIFRKFWGRVALRITLSTILIQLLLNGWDDTKEFYKEQLLSDQWKKFRWLGVDISKLYEALGIDLEGKRKTFSIGGHFFDPLKLVDPPRLIKHKGSPIVRVGEALKSGTDWRERPFVSATELLTGKKTVKASPYEAKEQFLNRLPATIVNQIVNLQPVQVGYWLRYLQGEEDALSALLQSAGMHMHTAWPPKLEGPITPAQEGDPVFDAIQDLIKSEALHMGAPSRRITAAGIPRKLTAAQYKEYLQESSDIVRRRLKDLIGSDRWSRKTPEQRAAIIEKVVKSARKRARQKLKKRYWKPGIKEAA